MSGYYAQWDQDDLDSWQGKDYPLDNDIPDIDSFDDEADDECA